MTGPGRPDTASFEYQGSTNQDSSLDCAGAHREWRYDYHGKRGADIAFAGHVIHVRGKEGERLLGDLATVLRELLEWAYGEQQSEDQDGEPR